jgi:hypothetical protein
MINFDLQKPCTMGPKLAYIYIVVRRYDPKSLYQMKKTFGHSGIGVKKDFCRVKMFYPVS